MQMLMFILLIIIGIMCIIFRLILRYKFKIPKSQYIDVNALQPKYFKHIMLVLFIVTMLISMHIRHTEYMSLWLLSKLGIDSVYRIKYLRNDKSRYYNILELIFWVYGCISVIASFFW
ncbi:hypothetical protein psyc5s11_04500 [Clostridium gelidum]|uniref:DUF4181 domain-containing protein n=1 Tax=Clostridium gelidum TaxID=704125 RepID=A0ABM7SXR7_9CLOT|nr:hypothetical protein [Clostridium gelidum]BCZ44383.1 hypothetical protein psyc5s11_04500 [Clostridium gelidum]